MSPYPTIQWTSWQPLYESWLGDHLPTQGGLYRIRRTDLDGIDYMGQTGKGTMNLKKRLGMLSTWWTFCAPFSKQIWSTVRPSRG